jgi:hypothetical protein
MFLRRVGMRRPMDEDHAVGDLLRLVAGTEVVLSAAERIDTDIVDEAVLAELRELHDRAVRVLARLEHRVDVW